MKCLAILVVVYTVRISAILADGLAALLTWYRTKELRKLLQYTPMHHVSIVSVLVDDGRISGCLTTYSHDKWLLLVGTMYFG